MSSAVLVRTRPASRLLPPALAGALLGALASLVLGAGPISVSTSDVAQYVNGVIQPTDTMVTTATDGLTPSAATDAQYVNGVLQPTDTPVTTATQAVTPSSEVVTPDEETPSTASQTLTPSSFTVSGSVSGLPSTTAEQTLTPSAFTVSGSVSGLPSTTAEQTLTPSAFTVSGSVSGLPSTTAEQTLTPTSFAVTGAESSGDAPTTSEVASSTAPLTPSTSSPAPYVNGVLNLAGQEQFPSSAGVSPSLDTPGHYVNGVLAASMTAGSAVCKGVEVPGDDTDGDGLTNAQEALLGTNPCVVDTDQDGCSDSEEVAPKSASVLGGGRNPLYFWDFFDPTRDKGVALGDFLAVIQRFGSQGDANVDPLSEPPPPPAYHTRFDRGGLTQGGNLWDELPANGQIALGDFLSLLRQFGHNCTALP